MQIPVPEQPAGRGQGTGDIPTVCTKPQQGFSKGTPALMIPYSGGFPQESAAIHLDFFMVIKMLITKGLFEAF